MSGIFHIKDLLHYTNEHPETPLSPSAHSVRACTVQMHTRELQTFFRLSTKPEESLACYILFGFLFSDRKRHRIFLVFSPHWKASDQKHSLKHLFVPCTLAKVVLIASLGLNYKHKCTQYVFGPSKFLYRLMW